MLTTASVPAIAAATEAWSRTSAGTTVTRVETERSQLNPRRVRMPHSDAYSHAFGGQAPHQSPTEEPPPPNTTTVDMIYSGTLSASSTKTRRPQCLFSGGLRAPNNGRWAAHPRQHLAIGL